MTTRLWTLRVRLDFYVKVVLVKRRDSMNRTCGRYIFNVE